MAEETRATQRSRTSNPQKVQETTLIRKQIRLSSHDWNRAQYWADRLGLSLSEVVADALDQFARRKSGESFGDETLIENRLSEVIGYLVSIDRRMIALQYSQEKGLDSLVGIARGDSMLEDLRDVAPEDGDLDLDVK